MPTIAIARSKRDILRCFPVMSQLRPHLVASEFPKRIRRQQREGGYVLAFLESRGKVRSIAGFRIDECLSFGRYMYVDDLVTEAAARSRGHGRELFDWLVMEARRKKCTVLRLDSGVQRFDAHRFYLARRMDIVCHHFALKLI